MYLTEKLADFVVDTKYKDVPEEARLKAKQCILDCLGVTLAGSIDPINKPIKEYLEEIGGKEQSTVIGLGIRTSAPNAAFANGVFGHVLDYDDTNQIFVGHSTVSILSAILAFGELLKSTGRDIITAFLIGTEVQWKIGDALVYSGDHYNKGWHSSCTIGTLGAVAAAGKLLQLDSEKMAHAFGIAASEAAGFQEQFGTHCKPFHAGRANENGVIAALLARGGFTSAKSSLEGKFGYVRLMADEYDLEKIRDFGKPWGILEPTLARGINLKMYPICGSGMGAAEGILSLIEEHDIKAEEVESVECFARPKYVEILKHHDPKTGLEAKFSMEYWMTIALLERQIGLRQFTDNKVQESKVREYIKRVRVSPDPSIQYPWSKVRIKVDMKDGRSYTTLYFPPKGTPENPMSDEELLAKYRGCAEWCGLPKEKTEESIELTMELEKLANVDELMKLMYQ